MATCWSKLNSFELQLLEIMKGWWFPGGWWWWFVFVISIKLLFLIPASAVTTRGNPLNNTQEDYPPVKLHRLQNYVVLDNGLVNVTLSIPSGMITGIQYNGIANLLQFQNKEHNRGYWDVVWTPPNDPKNGNIDGLEGQRFDVVIEDENQVEISFVKKYDNSSSSSADSKQFPFNIDKRYIMLRGSSGFYSYAIFERLEGWPDIDVSQGRIAFKLQENLFQFMVVGDEKQKMMPTSLDRERGQTLDYIEAVLLTNPANPLLRGEIDDKYQYSSDNKDNRVHGWICKSPSTGFWVITPSNEFKTAGPLKQDLTSHAVSTSLSMFFSNHYSGLGLEMKFREGEAWKKVFGPVFIYLNSIPQNTTTTDHLTLWADAKNQMLLETEKWPYDFPRSQDYPLAHQRGTISGRLLVNDRYISERLMSGISAYVGLAPPGDVGSWQRESKGYQFWTKADPEGYFIIKDVREGNYSLYAWVPGIIGDYKYDAYIYVTPGKNITLGNLIYSPPRTGPTIWEIGIPDRTAMEFFIPDPNPSFMNQIYSSPNSTEKFRQYGLWERYTELYPYQDLVFRVGIDNYKKDWFFAHVTRKTGNHTYIPTTWQIEFYITNVVRSAHYTLFIALASANDAVLKVRINNPYTRAPQFSTGLIGRDNAIARHGIHGLYWLYKVQVYGSQLLPGRNLIFLTQSRGSNPFQGLMYDYLRFEGPS